MASDAEAPRNSKHEFGESLPPLTRFKEKVDMASGALRLASQTEEQLRREINQANEELEAAGSMGRHVKFETPEKFTLRDEGILSFQNMGSSASRLPKIHHVEGNFEGLTVVDTAEVAYPDKALDELRGGGPERLIVCALISHPEEPDMSTYVPLKWLESPVYALMQGIGRGIISRTEIETPS